MRKIVFGFMGMLAFVGIAAAATAPAWAGTCYTNCYGYGNSRSCTTTCY